MAKVLLINGSPRANGNTALALTQMEQIFSQEGIEAEIVHIGHPIKDPQLEDLDAQGEPDARCDDFSVGVQLFEHPGPNDP